MKKTLLIPLVALSTFAMSNSSYAFNEEQSSPSVVIVSELEKININQADVSELAKLKGIGIKRAQAIVDYREKHGKFTSIEQLREIKGIGVKVLKDNESLLIL